MPPKSAPRESTQKTRSARSIDPSFLSQPPSDATDTTVPAVSKKSDSMSEKTVRIATKKPSLKTSRRAKLPFTDVNTAPIVEKSGVEERLAYAKRHRDADRKPFERDDTHRSLPGETGALDQTERDYGIDAEARCSGVGVVRPQCHAGREERGHQRGGRHDCRERNARTRKDDRVDHEDVRHDEEIRDAAADLCADGGACRAYVELPLDPVSAAAHRGCSCRHESLLRHAHTDARKSGCALWKRASSPNRAEHTRAAVRRLDRHADCGADGRCDSPLQRSSRRSSCRSDPPV